MQAGLIFVATDDSIGCINRAVIKQPYNYIGFFASSEEKGYTQTKVWIISVFDASKPSWLHKNTLDDLIEHPLVSAVAIKRLKPIIEKGVTDLDLTYQNIENFKLSICSALSNHNKINITNAIFKLFGSTNFPCENKVCENTADDLVNIVLKNFGISEELKIYEPEYRNVYESINFDPCAIFLFNFNQVYNTGMNLYSYLKENKYFEDLEKIDLQEKKSKLEINSFINKYNNDNKSSISEFFKVFNHHLSTNDEFFKLVKSGMNKKSSKDNKIEKIMEKLNFEVEKVAEITNDLVNDASKSRRHGVEKEINRIFADINKTRQMINEMTGSNFKNLKIH